MPGDSLTDPRSGDLTMGARWYNPASGTFNSRDTITHPAGVSSNRPNLYAYAGGNPLTYDDPTGHCPADPDTGRCESNPKKCGWKNIGDGDFWYCEPSTGNGGGEDDVTPIPCPKQTCWGPPADDEDKGCKKNCGDDDPGDGKCKPDCDKRCKTQKQAIKERERLERDAKNQTAASRWGPVLRQRQHRALPNLTDQARKQPRQLRQ